MQVAFLQKSSYMCTKVKLVFRLFRISKLFDVFFLKFTLFKINIIDDMSINKYVHTFDSCHINFNPHLTENIK